MARVTTRPPRPGYRAHDHVTEWQECDTCHLRTGAGLTTKYDDIYYADGWDPARCPKCDAGRMCLPDTAGYTAGSDRNA